MTTIETKEARLNELKAELAEIRAEMKDDSISNARWGRLQNYRYEIRCEIEKLQAEIDAEIDANIKKVAAQKVDAILTSGVQPVIVNTTFKNNRCSVNIDGAKVSLDKAVTILCESELARCGENVLLINENFDVCPLDEDLFILGKHNVKTAIRQFARGEKVTGAKVLNGKFYPVVKANAEPAAETAVEEPATVEEPAESLPESPNNDGDELIDTPESAPVEEPATIETKIAKNDTLICKFNGKRVAWHNALAALEINPVGTVVAGNGHSYTCITNNVPAPDGLTYETGYLFEDENGNRYIFDNPAFAIRAIAHNNVDEYAVTQDATVEETAESLPESPASVVKPLNFTAKIIYDNGCTDARFASYDEAYSWIKDQENVFPRFNSTITFFNRETLDAELLYQNSNDDTEPEPPNNDDTEPEPPNNDGDELIDTPESAPVEERKLTRRESLEIDKQVVMSEIDEYREGLIEYQDDPDVNPTHIDFLKSSIDSKLAEYYDICKQLDELDDEPNPAPEPETPAPEVNVETVKYVATQITFPTGHEGEPTREVSKTFDNLDDAAKFIADDNPFIETETGYHTFAYDDGYFGGVYWAGYRIETTDGKILVEADIYEVKGDESIDRLVIKYINDNENTVPEPPANNPLACLNNLGYEDDVIEPVHETVDETDTTTEYAVMIAQLKDACDSAVAAWSAVDYNARTNKSLRPVVKTALATVNAAGTALQAFGDAHLSELSPLLNQTIRGATIRIINEDGIDWGSQKLADISLKFRRTGPDFAIIANDNYYATCATPDDVRRVIERLKQSITCGAAEFSFAPQNFTPEPVDDDADDDEYASISEDGITYVPLARGHNVSADRFYLKVQGFPVTEYQRTTALPSDTVAGVARICATVNAAAPEGWEVYYDTPSKLFAVMHNDETVARLTSVELYDAWDAHPPEDFFNAYDTHDVVEFDDDGNISAIWF